MNVVRLLIISVAISWWAKESHPQMKQHCPLGWQPHSHHFHWPQRCASRKNTPFESNNSLSLPSGRYDLRQPKSEPVSYCCLQQCNHSQMANSVECSSMCRLSSAWTSTASLLIRTEDPLFYSPFFDFFVLLALTTRRLEQNQNTNCGSRCQQTRGQMLYGADSYFTKQHCSCNQLLQLTLLLVVIVD